MGLRADIFRTASLPDCSNHGISSLHHSVVIVNVDGPSEPSGDAPAVCLLPGNLPGTLKVVPLNSPPGQTTPMMGGTYICTSDSRFSEACAAILGTRFYGAVAFHDRFETWEEYNRNID